MRFIHKTFMAQWMMMVHWWVQIQLTTGPLPFSSVIHNLSWSPWNPQSPTCNVVKGPCTRLLVHGHGEPAPIHWYLHLP